MHPADRIFVAGAEGFIGRALISALQAQGFEQLCGTGAEAPDLTHQQSVTDFFRKERPDYVFLVAGKSGGISANQRRPATLMLDNLLTQALVIEAAHRNGVRKLLYLASSCVYPKLSQQPMRPDMLFGSPLEPTNDAYATAKLSGLKLVEAYRREYGVSFINVIPPNLFGPGDDYSLEDSHVVGALIRRMHEARATAADEVSIWGTGKAKREFLFVNDLADALIFLMKCYDATEPINVGSGSVVTIGELAETIAKIVGYEGRLAFDHTRTDGMPFKSLDSSPLFTLGWRSKVPLQDALRATYQDFQEQYS